MMQISDDLKLAILGISVAAFGSANAARSVVAPKSAAPTMENSAPPNGMQAPFDLASEVLPGGGGHSCDAVSASISTLDLKKGEFETSSAFSSRMDASANLPLFGSVYPASLFAFAVHERDNSARYDADTQLMKVSIRYYSDQILKAGSTLVPSVIVNQRTASQGRYEGSNAYGAKAQIDRIKLEVCALGIVNAERGPYRVGWKERTVTYRISAEKAQEMKGHVAIVYVGTLQPPYVQEFYDFLRPTLDHPVDKTYGGKLLLLQLHRTLIIDERTGEILGQS
jgi:hypothetical protein